MDGVNENSLMDCDIDATLVITENLKHKKGRKRKKIRRLVDCGKDKNKKKDPSHKNCTRILTSIIFVTLTIALLMGHYFTQNNVNTTNMLREFSQIYRNQYKGIVHGKSDYCDQKLDTAALFATIQQNRILHQEQVLHELKSFLHNESDINAIAFVGPVGVGKSLLIRTIHQHFPWQENIHFYAWNTYMSNEDEKFHLLQTIINNLSECGKNLLVIENLRASDYDVVAIINQMVIEANNKQPKKILLFYVFSLNKMLSAQGYEVEKESLKSLSDCPIINFKPFTQLELRDCIWREADIENVTLTKENFDEIVDTIDPHKSGCKNVNAKVLTYGTIKTQIDIN